MYPPGAKALRYRQQKSAVTVALPVPSAGVNAISNLAEMAVNDAVYSFNLYPAQYGLKVREGYEEWADTTDPVRTLIPYVGTESVSTRLFACLEDGIYDVTTGGAAPVLVESFPTADTTSGYGVWTTFTTLAGKFILYCDESNGYYVYSEATDSWDKVAMGAGPTEIDGVDPDDFAYVMVWKSRVWFIQKGTGLAWYLDAGALFGTATSFNFGNKFKYGGNLKALFNWTVDGGEGVDDYLVAVSDAGDVITYKGTDPDVAASFDQRGQWYIGSVPAGRRIGGSFGGELYLLSSYGLIPTSKLLSGQLIQQAATTVSARITPLINQQMRLSRTQLGWEVKLIPNQNLLIISTPKQPSLPYLQFVYSIDVNSWGVFRDIPYYTGEVWQDEFYIGTALGSVVQHTGSTDDADFDGTNGIDIEWSLLTSFQDHGFPGQFRIPEFIRPVFIGGQAPSFIVKAVFDYNLIEISETPSPSPGSGDVWDAALWDVALWGGDFLTSDQVRGAAGIGRAIAIALKGNSSSEITLIRFDLTFRAGGVL